MAELTDALQASDIEQRLKDSGNRLTPRSCWLTVARLVCISVAMKSKHALLLITTISASLSAGCDSKAPQVPTSQKQSPVSSTPSAVVKPNQSQDSSGAAKSSQAQTMPSAKVAVAPKPPEAPRQGLKPRPNLQKTKQLFDSISSKRPGSVSGKVEWRDGLGILLHPGTTPTGVVFDLSKFKGNANLVFWISRLPDRILAQPNAGTAAFTVEIDGKKDGRKIEIKMPRKKVDRFTVETIPVNFSGASTMKVTVDDGDGAQFCDWIFMGVE
ncbi:MAG: hypothetical protein ACKOLA_05010 [Spartobacteria bacterium]